MGTQEARAAKKHVSEAVVKMVNYLIAQMDHVVHVLMGQFVLAMPCTLAKGGKQKIVMEVVLPPLLVLHINNIGTRTA